MSTITVDHLTRDYGAGRGVFDLSLEVGSGEVFGFLGPNGAGKTTTIRHLMGFLKPQSGRCLISGRDCWRDVATIQADVGYIPGELNLFDDMTGSRYLAFLAAYRRSRKRDRAAELLERLDLDPSGRIKKMSKGMKQKLGIVAAFMHSPAVLILDEPTAGLDPLMQARFVDLLTEEKQRGTTVLMSSHMFEEVERTCDQVGIIKAGTLVAIDSVTALKARQTQVFTVGFISEEQANQFVAAWPAAARGAAATVQATVANNLSGFIAELARYQITSLTAPTQSLEEVFMHYYGGDN